MSAKKTGPVFSTFWAWKIPKKLNCLQSKFQPYFSEKDILPNFWTFYKKKSKFKKIRKKYHCDMRENWQKPTYVSVICLSISMRTVTIKDVWISKGHVYEYVRDGPFSKHYHPGQVKLCLHKMKNPWNETKMKNEHFNFNFNEKMLWCIFCQMLNVDFLL